MKKQSIALVLFFIAFTALAQSPQLINYQGVARDQAGDPITNPVGLKFEIIFGNPSTTAVYSEEKTVTPDIGGVFNSSIGSGPATLGNFSTINWGSGPHYLRVSLDPSGGTAFFPISTTQLLSVPYALYAEKAGNAAQGATTNITAQGLVSLTNTATNYTLDVKPANLSYNITNQVLSLSQGSFVSTATLTSPPATVSIVGPGVTGGPTNYTISSTPQPTLIATGVASATNTPPNYTVDVPPPSISYNQATKVLTLLQGLSVSTTTILTPSITLTPGSNINIANAGPIYTISSPNYSISFPSNTLISLTNGMSTANAIIPPQNASLTLSGPNANQLSAGANTVSLADYTVGAGLIKTGTHPNFTLAASTTGTNAAWGTLGNAGTNTVTNFIGTTDNVDLNFRTNGSTRVGRIYSTKSSLFFGKNSGPTNEPGNFNVGYGENTLMNLTGGSENTAIGSWALRDVTTGAGNVGLGSEALISQTTGNSNVGLGYRAGFSNAVGIGNVFFRK